MVRKMVCTIGDRVSWLSNNLNNSLLQLILNDGVILGEEFRCLSKPLEETQQPLVAELTMVQEWRMTFLPL